MPGYNSTSPTAGTIRLRSIIPLVLTVAGFTGGFAIAVFYNVALRPLPVDTAVPVPQVTTEPYANEAMSPRYYPRLAQASGESATNGSGGSTVQTPEERARARAARAERRRIDSVMRICSGC